MDNSDHDFSYVRSSLKDGEIREALEIKNSIRPAHPEIDSIDDDEFIARWHLGITTAREKMTETLKKYRNWFALCTVAPIIVIALSITTRFEYYIIVALTSSLVLIYGLINLYNNAKINTEELESSKVIPEMKDTILKLSQDRKRTAELSKN